MSRQRGFTLLEVIVVLFVLTILASAIGPGLLKNRLSEQRTGVMSREMLTLSDGAATFLERNGTWPDEANACAGALAAMIADGTVAGINGVSPWNTAYGFDCTNPSILTISGAAGNTDWASALAGSLPASTLTGTTVGTNISRTLSLAALDDVLHRDFDPARPELNRMETAIDMDYNDIVDIQDLNYLGNLTGEGAVSLIDPDDGDRVVAALTPAGTAGSQFALLELNGSAAGGGPEIRFDPDGDGFTAGTDPGVAIPDADQMQITGLAQLLVNNAEVRAGDFFSTDSNVALSEIVRTIGIVGPGEVVPKPNCPAGFTPAIAFGLAGFQDRSPNADLVRGAFALLQNETASGWRLRVAVQTTTATVYPSSFALARILAVTKCNRI